ncbi:MAG: hypothetical protein ABIH39_03335 [Candidatus Margulisiibacteriota bacterium]
MNNPNLSNKEQLTKAQLAQLKKWQKNMIIYFIAFLSGLGLLLLVGLTIGFSKSAETILTIAWVIFLLSGVYIQFAEKCPRCGYRIGFQSRLILPPKCAKCGVSYKKAA